jgi:protein-disulfide isomerase
MAIVSIAIIGLLIYLLLRPQQVVVSADDDPFVGPEKAKATVIEFFDFQCPACRAVEPIVEQARKNYKDRVKFVARDLPITYHQFAQKAAEASECAHEQEKYWEYHDLLMNGSLDIASLKKYAKDLGLDTAQFNECLDSGKYYSETQKDYNDGVSYGVTGTPTFFVNGKKISVKSYADFQAAIESALIS